MKTQLELARIFNAASSFKKLEIQKIYQNEPESDGVRSWNNLLKIKTGACVNLDEFTLIGTHWIAFYVNDHNIIYFLSFRAEHITTEI